MDEPSDEVMEIANEAVRKMMHDPPKWRFPKMQMRPMYYDRDGTPIEGETREEATLKWAKMFESRDRTVAVTKTLYGERLSTVFLGLDHSFSMTGPPILFETMLFAPESDELRKAKWERLRKVSASFKLNEAIAEQESCPMMGSGGIHTEGFYDDGRCETCGAVQKTNEAIEEMETFAEEKYIEEHYPHDNLQERYSTEAQAAAGHQRIKRQCLIPPRWRRFLLYTIGKDPLWS